MTALVTADIGSRDVHQEVSETLAARGPGLAYSRLLRLKTGPDIIQPSLALECELCLSWEIPDPLTYRFHLRDDVRWQDIHPVNGRKLVAEDVAFSYERQATEGWPNASLLRSMAGVQAEDDVTLRVDLHRHDSDFLLALADGHSKIVAREVVEGVGGLESGPVVGSGPWRWLKTERDVGSSLEANPDYFEKGLPFLERLDFLLIRAPETQVAAFLTGSLDVYDIPPGTRAEYQPSLEGFPTFFSRQAGRGPVMAVNAGRPPFDDANTRRALFKALDPVGYRDGVWSGMGFLGAGVPVLDAVGLVDQGWSAALFNDPAEAKALLGGEAPEVGLLVADFGPLYRELGRRMEEDLQEAGFRPRMEVLSPVEYSERVWQEREHQLFVGPAPPTSGPSSYLFSAYHSAGQWNVLDHGNAALDDLIEAQAELLFDDPFRGELIRSIQELLIEEGYAFSPVNQTTVWLLQENVRGFAPNSAASEYFYWAKTWLSED